MMKDVDTERAGDSVRSINTMSFSVNILVYTAHITLCVLAESIQRCIPRKAIESWSTVC